MTNEEYANIHEKLESYAIQNKQLRQANTKKDKTIRRLRRVIKRLKDAEKKKQKQHYKNGRRGTIHNG